MPSREEKETEKKKGPLRGVRRIPRSDQVGVQAYPNFRRERSRKRWALLLLGFVRPEGLLSMRSGNLVCFGRELPAQPNKQPPLTSRRHSPGSEILLHSSLQSKDARKSPQPRGKLPPIPAVRWPNSRQRGIPRVRGFLQLRRPFCPWIGRDISSQRTASASPSPHLSLGCGERGAAGISGLRRPAAWLGRIFFVALGLDNTPGRAKKLKILRFASAQFESFSDNR
jgi:hypothetical protein